VKAAVIVPNWKLPPSGGRKGLHLISKTLMDNGVDCVTVGWKYEHAPIGDTVIPPPMFHPDEETVFILPEGVNGLRMAGYFLDMLDLPHGPVVQYIQSTGLTDPHQEWATNYWGLGPLQREIAGDKMKIPADMPIEELRQPVDTEWWKRVDEGYSEDESERIPGSILYSTSRNVTVLDSVARKCGTKPAFRVAGATQEELRTLMTIADIFVLASTSEGQSSILNEAMSMELACVTWPSGGLPDIITHEQNGMMVAQNDTVGLADCVRNLQKDPERARELGKNAREWCVENLSVKGFESRLMELWSKLPE